MKAFAALYERLDATTRATVKVAALADYLQTAPEADRIWTVALFSGRRPRRAITATALRLWAAEAAGLPDWLFEDAYAVAGDLAETIALVLPPPARHEERGLSDWIAEIEAITALPEAARKARILQIWDSLPRGERFLFTKLLTGGFRVGLSQGLMARALAQATGLPQATLALRLMGNWTPATLTWGDLTGATGGDPARPYPFCLAPALEEPEALGEAADWLAEWKWDGIRAQLVHRPGAFAIWSRGEELVTDRFPELAVLSRLLPRDCVLDGEVLAWAPGGPSPLPFAALQKRLGRKTVPRALLSEAPVRLLAYDLLEEAGEDLRALPLSERRARLAALLGGLPPGTPVAISPEAQLDGAAFAGAEDLIALRDRAAAQGAEGLMLKRRDSPYGAGRHRGDWWKWKRQPMTVDAVMIYAQAGHGRRANLFTDYTFAVRDGDNFVPFAKAYSGLTDAEFAAITTWVRAHTLQRFGPVRQVPPELVFELAFEGIQESPRHKSGIALRFPRMLRWRRDKPASEIDTIESLRALLPRS